MSNNDIIHLDAHENAVFPFQIETLPFRGRLVRMNSVATSIVEQHRYPPLIAAQLIEAMLLAAAISSGFKYEGMLTLQMNGDGPVTMLVADYKTSGALRAYASFDEEKIKALAAENPNPDLKTLFGKGYLAFTVDQVDQVNRYQGIVELEGKNIAECLQHYFEQSVQVPTKLVSAVIHNSDQYNQSHWQGGCLMLQKMPEGRDPFNANDNDLVLLNQLRHEENEDSWHRCGLYLASCQDEELASASLPATELLHRLFHEDGYLIYEPQTLFPECRCSREKITDILKSLPENEVMDLREEGVVTVDCQFCGKIYHFDDRDLQKLYNQVKEEDKDS